MNSKINFQVLKTVRHDSGALNPLGMVLHQLTEPGVYRASIYHQGKPVAETDFQVDAAGPVQLNLDLAASHRATQGRPAGEDCACHAPASAGALPMVSPKGYVLFYVSSGDGYSVKVAAGREKVVFDSTKLQAGDLYATSLLEPGYYAGENSENGAKAGFEVRLTADDAKRLRGIEPQYVDAGKTFEPGKTTLLSSQGLVFRIKEPARIVIERQGERTGFRPEKPSIRWTKPVLAR